MPAVFSSALFLLNLPNYNAAHLFFVIVFLIYSEKQCLYHFHRHCFSNNSSKAVPWCFTAALKFSKNLKKSVDNPHTS